MHAAVQPIHAAVHAIHATAHALGFATLAQAPALHTITPLAAVNTAANSSRRDSSDYAN